MFLTLLQSRTTPIVVLPTKGGVKKRKKHDYADEIAGRELRHAQIVDAFERLVEGKSSIVEAIAAEFKPQAENPTVRVDWDRLLADVDAVERIWAAYLEADDEDVLILL